VHSFSHQFFLAQGPDRLFNKVSEVFQECRAYGAVNHAVIAGERGMEARLQ